MVPINIRRQLALGCLILLLGAIFIGGEQPGVGSLFPAPWDKVVHLMVFGSIGAFVAIAFPSLSLTAIVLVVAAAGAADEVHQMLLPGRQPGLDDWLADMLGAVLALPFISRLRSAYCYSRR